MSAAASGPVQSTITSRTALAWLASIDLDRRRSRRRLAPMAVATRPSDAGSDVPFRCAGAGSIGRSEWPSRAKDTSLIAGGDRTAVPDRRQLARLPRVLRAARHDRHLEGRADQRDLRLRLDAREDPDRVRHEADAGGLGRRLVGPRAGLHRVQGRAPLAARPAARSSGRSWSRWSRRSATRTCGSRASRPTT